MQEDPFITGLRQVFTARPNLKPATVADKAGLDKSTIRMMFEGRSRSPKVATCVAIATALGMTVEEILALAQGDPATRTRPIAVAGIVGAGARVPLLDAYEKGDGHYLVARPPQLIQSGIVAVEVEGDSMAPMYQPGHLLFFSRATHEGILEEDIGQPCIVEDADGLAWVKLVKRGSEQGLWNLISLNPAAESVWDKPIKWASRVRLALPADLVKRI